MKGVEFSDLGRLKEKDLLRVSEEIDAIRRHRPMTTSFPLNKVDDELGDFRSPDDDKAVRVFGSFFFYGESDLDNELSDPFEEDRHQGQLTKDSGSFETSDSGFKEDIEVFLSGAIDSFGGGSKRSEFLVTRRTPDDFSDQAGVLFDRYMLNESVVIDEERAALRVGSEFFVLRWDTLSLAGKGRSLTLWIETVGSA